MESDNVSLFLQENYLTYYNCTDDIESVTEYMSFSDLFSNLNTRTVLGQYEISVMTRSILFWNQSTCLNSIGFQKHFKPQIYDCLRKSRELNLKVCDKFVDKLDRSSFSLLCQLQLPYEGMILGGKRNEILAGLNSFPTRRKYDAYHSGQPVEDDEDLIVENYQSYDNHPSQLSKEKQFTWLEVDDIVDY